MEKIEDDGFKYSGARRSYDSNRGSVFILRVLSSNTQQTVFRSVYNIKTYRLRPAKEFGAEEFEIYTIEVDDDAVVDEKFLLHNKVTGYFDVLKNAVKINN